MYLTASGSGEGGSLRTAPIARLVPASAAVPTPAADHEQNHDDDQKCRRVHADLLEMIMGRRVPRPDGSPTWQSWACRTPALTLLRRGCYLVCAILIIRTWPDGLRRHLSFSSPETALGSGCVEPKLDRACSKSHRRQTSAGAPCCGWRGATESCHERCATLPHERGGMPVGSRAVRTVLSWSDTCGPFQ
jgi:hypothetical protein